MFGRKEKIDIKEIVFVSILIIFVILLFLFPTGFENRIKKDVIRAQGRILETDDSGVQQFGIIKQGAQRVKAKVLNGKFKNQEILVDNILIGKMELDKFFVEGDKVLLAFNVDGNKEKILTTNVVDHFRINTELFLLVLFVLMLILFAGWVGLKAVISFLFTAGVIWKLLLPNYLRGYDPVILSMIITNLLMGVIIFLVSGLTKKGLVAFIGCFCGILLTCILAVIFGKTFRIHGAVKPFSETLLYSGFGYLNLSKIFIAGIFLASSGAVMDLATDISASMNELVHKHPEISVKDLISSGFTVGRVVIGTMTTTLLLAYSGGFSTMLMVFMAQGTPIINILNINYVAAEILHTLVGSFGLVTVAPFTAIIGGFIYVKKTGKIG